jgi:branched-chain amino acid transport system permease protein
MSLSSLLLQFLTGLSSASSLFLVGAGLSLIFGVTRIVNFAHGSFFMVGIYLAYTLVEKLGGGMGFWPALVIAALAVGILGALIEMVLLRRIYKSPELFQLLATFALVLVIKDAVLYIWGPDELLGPRAPGLSGSVEILGRQFPTYDLFLIVVGPVVLGLMWLLLTRTRWGTLVRAATQDREMVSALGVNQAWLFTAVFALGALLAGLGGALQLPREPATLEMDLNTIGAAFVVVVVGGMGSLAGAFLASLIIGVVQTFAVAMDQSLATGLQALGVTVSDQTFGYELLKLTISQVAPILPYLFLVLILIFRPKGLLGTRED